MKSLKVKKNTRLYNLGIISLSLLFSVAACSSKEEPKVAELISAASRPELELLTAAMDAYDDKLYAASQNLFADLLEGYPASAYSVLAELKIADSFFFTGDYDSAIARYEDFVTLRPGHEATPYASFQIAESNFKKYVDEKRDQAPLLAAMEHYQAVIEKYPNSSYAVESRTAVDTCRKSLAQHEKLVATYYVKQGEIPAAANRLVDLERQFGDLRVSQLALEELKREFPENTEKLGEEIESLQAELGKQKKDVSPEEPILLSAAITREATTRDTAAAVSGMPELAPAEDSTIPLAADESPIANCVNHPAHEVISIPLPSDATVAKELHGSNELVVELATKTGLKGESFTSSLACERNSYQLASLFEDETIRFSLTRSANQPSPTVFRLRHPDRLLVIQPK